MAQDIDKFAQNPSAKGGEARAKILSKEQRSEIARKAANSRWNADVPNAICEGEFKIGDMTVEAAVLANGKRLLTQAAFLRTLGRSRSPKAGTGVMSTVDGLPFFLQADALKPFITDDLAASTTPIFFCGEDGRRSVGYDAELLPQVAEVYLRFRDSCLANGKSVPKKYAHIVEACDIIIRGLARVGIAALVDEATGYQAMREKNALAQILENFIDKELRPWVSTFPADFYHQMFRLRGLEFSVESVKRPQYFGILTNDLVYKRLAPGVLEELKRVTPRSESGRLKHKYFQRLTQNVGYPKLREHLGAVVAFMRLSTDWGDFMEKLDRHYPRHGETMMLPFPNGDDDGRGL